jgi:hypothetical protein
VAPSSVNYAATAIFIVFFALLVVLIRRHLAKFVSFYVLRKDYLRMRTIERTASNAEEQEDPRLTTENKGNAVLPTSSRQSLLNGSANGSSNNGSRQMLLHEVLVEYRNALKSNIRIYHPVAGLLPSRFMKSFRGTVRLPRQITCTLMMAGLIITLTLSLALGQATCQRHVSTHLVSACLDEH